jgi:hypothetical protein
VDDRRSRFVKARRPDDVAGDAESAAAVHELAAATVLDGPFESLVFVAGDY